MIKKPKTEIVNNLIKNHARDPVSIFCVILLMLLTGAIIVYLIK